MKNEITNDSFALKEKSSFPVGYEIWQGGIAFFSIMNGSIVIYISF